MILYTEVIGEGEPIVFLHTGLQTGTTDFEQQVEHFKQHYKVILPDLRGHGKSVSNDLANYFQDTAQDLADTLDHLGIDSVHVVGCSLGGIVSIFLAKKFQDKVKSLTISGVTSEKPEKWDEMHAADVEHQTQLLQNKEAIALFDSMHEGDWRQFIYMARDASWYPFNDTKDIDTLTMPVLFMVDEKQQDEVKTATIYPETNQHVHVSVIPFAGHLVHAEQPEIYTSILERFLGRLQ
ncbi:alpha/beta fold hydrolase [Virgibacillus sp. DJP39]|uniref:alpha/beta fold hydrolase n=1 Tax=Virgibacillus sp. DJP39 TaxID=3409790 RepID=UPI003BB72381